MTTQPHYIREWRKERGWTQLALAEAMGVDRTLVNKLERFAHRYNQDVLEAAAKALGCSTAELLVRDPSDPHGFWSEYDRLDAEQRQRTTDFMRGINSKRVAG
jgi:transcriptional regulator with XRE-family HTH domain